MLPLTEDELMALGEGDAITAIKALREREGGGNMSLILAKVTVEQVAIVMGLYEVEYTLHCRKNPDAKKKMKGA